MESTNIISCPQKSCSGVLIESKNIKTSYKWAIPLLCSKCNALRYRCKLCETNYAEYNNQIGVNKLLLRDRMWKHNLIHLKKAKKENVASTECREIVNHEYASETLSGATYRTNKKLKLSTIEDISETKNFYWKENLDMVASKTIYSDRQVKNIYDNDITHEFFSKNASMNNKENGVINMVGKAVLGSLNGHKHLDPDDVLLHLFMAKFTSSLTIDQKHLFGLVLQIVIEKTTKNMKMENVDDESVKSYISTKCPVTESEMRRFYYGGVNSIVQNLPQPSVNLYKRHAYVSIRQCIADFLGKGNLPDSIDDQVYNVQRKLSQSIAARDVYLRAVNRNPTLSPHEIMVILGVQWSDDFEPNTSSKVNRGSVWMKTVTILSNDFETNVLKNTYIISMGLKSSNHSDVERKYLKECEELGNGIDNIFYAMKLRRHVYVHFEIIAAIADQPERRSMNNLMLGNSMFVPRFRYAANVKEIAKILPACNQCVMKLKSNEENDIKDGKCDNCVNWDIFSDL